MKYRRVMIPVCAVLALAGSPAVPAPTRAAAVVASSGSYQLTEQMLENALWWGQFLAGQEFTPTDLASLRADLIVWFHKEPANQVENYEVIANNFRQARELGPNKPPASMLALAIDRYHAWQWYGEHQDAFREFQGYPFGKMVLKYNPVLVNSGGFIVTRVDVDCQFYTNNLVAQAAGVTTPTEAEKQQFIRSLPARFASLSQDQREYLRQADVRLADLRMVYDRSIKTHAAVIADIRNSVHSPGQVESMARQVENDSLYTGKYYQLFRSEELAAGFNAARVNSAVLGLGRAGRSAVRSGDINTPVGTR